MDGKAAWRIIALVAILGALLVSLWVYGKDDEITQPQSVARAPIPCDQLEVHLISIQTDPQDLAQVIRRLCECDVPLSQNGREAFFRQYLGALSLRSIEEMGMIPAYENALVCRAPELLPHWLDKIEQYDAEAFDSELFWTPSLLSVFVSRDDFDVEPFRPQLERLREHPNELVSEEIEEFLAALNARETR